MLHRDYLLRLVRDMGDALYRLLHLAPNDPTDRKAEIDSLWRLAGLDPDHIHACEPHEILIDIADEDPDNFPARLEMAAMLLRAEAHLRLGTNEQIRHSAYCALELYRQIDDTTYEYSAERLEYMQGLLELLSHLP